MSSRPTEIEYASLGEYLRETRINLGLDLLAVTGETKISSRSLQAMEENNFAALPAEAFARGFYTLYAKCLSLDAKEVLQMYTQQRPSPNKPGNIPTIPASKLAQEVGNMAERPTFVPFSFFGLVLLLLLFFGGFLCWYFSWNPASYLSQKLRSLDEPQRIEQVSASQTEPSRPEPNVRFTQLPKPRSKHLDIFNLSYPSAAIAEDIPKAQIPPPSQGSKYYIRAEFREEPEIKLPEHLVQ